MSNNEEEIFSQAKRRRVGGHQNDPLIGWEITANPSLNETSSTSSKPNLQKQSSFKKLLRGRSKEGNLKNTSTSQD